LMIGLDWIGLDWLDDWIGLDLYSVGNGGMIDARQ